MDARVKSRVAAYGQPAAQAGAAGAGGSGSAPDEGYSDSLGNVGADLGDDNGHDTGPSPVESLKEAVSHFGELREFASYYVAAKWDGIKLSLRNVGIYAALGIVGLIAASAIITTAVVLLLVGLAWGLGILFGHQWLGALVVGLLVLGGIAGGIIFGMKWLTRTSRKRTVQKYENRQRDQRINFGEDVRGRRAGDTERSASRAE